MVPNATAPADDPAAATHVGGRRRMREDDLLRFAWVADPQISPDGTRVAFTRVTVDAESDNYLTTIWIADVAGAGARPLTNGKWDTQARWSPDGSALAFVRKADAEQPAQLHVLPMGGGEAVKLTSLEKGASSPAWSPDGKRLAFLSGTNPALDAEKKPKPKHEPARVVTRPVFRMDNEGFLDFEHPDHVWVIDAAGGTPRALTHGRFSEGAPRWSRDGHRVLFVSDRREEPWWGQEESRLWAVSADLATPTDGDALELVIEYKGAVVAFDEAADGRIATIGKVLGDAYHSYEQMDVLLAGGTWPLREPKRVNAARDHAFGETLGADQHPPRGGGATPFAFAEHGRAIVALASRHGGAMLVRVDVESGEVRELTPITKDIVMGTGTPDGRFWAVTMGDTTAPGDLVLVDALTGACRTLHAPNATLLSEIATTAAEEFWYTSFDGRRIQGWLVKPPDFDPAKRWPLVLQIHGGPHAAYGVGYYHEFHVLAGAGHVVLYTNPRGSTSYGEEFADCIQYRYPGDDANDLLAAVDEVVKHGWVDEKRIGVTGGSGGGLLTNWLVAHTGRFAAAVTQRCVADWGSMWFSSDFALFEPNWFRRPPYEDPEEYRARSPIASVANIHTPLMIIHSEEDWRCPIGQAETMFRALKHLRRTVVLVRFPGEGHELSRSGMPSRRVQNQEHIRAWFDRWLLGKPAPQYGV